MLQTLICDTWSTFDRVAAELCHSAIVSAVAERGVARVALSGGSTPEATYRLLAGLPWERDKVRWFWVDERALPTTSDRSNYLLARKSLLEPAGVPESGVVRIEVERQPLDLAARHYSERLLAEFGLTRKRALELDSAGRSQVIFDLVVAGIGTDGHTASLFPGTGAALIEDELTLAVVAPEPLEPRVTLTRPVLSAARRILILCRGEEKRLALQATLESGSEDQLPARIYQRARPDAALVIADRAAAGPGSGGRPPA